MSNLPQEQGSPDVVLEARDVTKTFPGVLALDKVNFCVYRGRLNALVGENGAGKSTLMKILGGILRPDAGQILLNGTEVLFDNPAQAQKQGIAVIHQELNLIPYLSVAENIFLGREFRTRLGLVDYAKMHRETTRILEQLDFHVEPKCIVARLSVGQQQIVEIAKSLSTDARIIIMDEPTSAISEHEIDVLFGLIENLKRRGVAIVYITHKLGELFRIGDYVTAMRDGKVVGGDVLSRLGHDDLVRMMVGRDLKDLYRRNRVETGDEAMRVERLAMRSHGRGGIDVEDVSFHVNRGEVLGIFGLMGSGRTELLQIIFGYRAGHARGDIFLGAKRIMPASPGEAIKAGIVLAPEDRKEQGLVLGMDIASNVSMASLSAVRRLGFLLKKAELNLANAFVERLGIKTPSVRQKVRNLSGGNQQKVILAKWLATKPTVLLLDEPTRGIDVNAKREIYCLIDELTAQGLAVVLVSSELPEILGLSDRIMVMSEGRKTAEFLHREANEEVILKAALPRSA